MGCGKSKEAKRIIIITQSPGRESDDERNDNYATDIWEKEDWDDFRRKSHIDWEDPGATRRETMTRINSGGDWIDRERPEWRIECKQRLEFERLSQRYSLKPCRYMERSALDRIKEICSSNQDSFVDQHLKELLQDEAAKEVIRDRQTLPLTLPAKKQLAINILTRGGRRAAPKSSSN